MNRHFNSTNIINTRIIVAIIFVMIAFVCQQVFAADGRLTVQLNVENDIFGAAMTDYHYTNGIQLRLINDNMNEIYFGHIMFNPKKNLRPYLIEDDRPYAAWLYAGVARRRIVRSRLDTLEVTLGIVGPAAFGEQFQKTIHKIMNAYEVRGWDNQLQNEPMLMITWSSIWRLNAASSDFGGFAWDVLPRVAASLGTPYTRLGFGFEARFGWNLPDDYDSLRIKPGSGVNVPRERTGAFVDRLSVYGFVGSELRAVLWNTFLDGNAWRASHSVDKKIFAGEISAGVVAEYGNARVAYTHVYMTKEFNGQITPDMYGSIMASYRF